MSEDAKKKADPTEPDEDDKPGGGKPQYDPKEPDADDKKKGKKMKAQLDDFREISRRQ